MQALTALFLWSLPLSSAYRVWPDWALVRGQRIDYYGPALFLADLVLVGSFLLLPEWRRFLVGVINQLKRSWLVWLGGLVTAGNLALSLNFPLTAFYWFQWFWAGIAGLLVSYASRQLGKRKIAILFGVGLVGQVILGLSQVIVNSSLGVWFDQHGYSRLISQALWLLGEVRFTSITPGIATGLVFGNVRIRAYGTLPHPNILAGFLLVAVSLLALETAQGFRVRLMSLLTLLLFLGLIPTMSRSAWLAAATAGLVSWFRFWRQPRLEFGFGLAIFCLSLIFFRDRWLSLLGFDQSAWRERVWLFQAGWQMMKHRPLLGVGLGAFISSLPTVVTDIRLAYLLQPVHNLFWLVLAETGLIGFGYLVLVGRKLKPVVKTDCYLPLVVFLLALSDHYFLTTHQGRFLLATTLALALDPKIFGSRPNRQPLLRWDGACHGLVPPGGFLRFARSRRSAGLHPPAPPVLAANSSRMGIVTDQNHQPDDGEADLPRA